MRNGLDLSNFNQRILSQFARNPIIVTFVLTTEFPNSFFSKAILMIGIWIKLNDALLLDAILDQPTGENILSFFHM